LENWSWFVFDFELFATAAKFRPSPVACLL
jgi:hypothetical protein